MRYLTIVILILLITGCASNLFYIADKTLKEELSFLLLKKYKSEEVAKYCLKISDKNPSIELVQKLNEIQIDPSACHYTDNAGYVYLKKFKKENPAMISATYGYSCGSGGLCSAEYKCYFKKGINKQFQFNRCDIRWIS